MHFYLYSLLCHPLSCVSRIEGGRGERRGKRQECFSLTILVHGLPILCTSKAPTCQCRRLKRCGFNPLVRKIPWRRKWQPAPVSLPGKSHGQRRLVGYSPWVHKELDTTERLDTYTFLSTIGSFILRFDQYFKMMNSLIVCFKGTLGDSPFPPHLPLYHNNSLY